MDVTTRGQTSGRPAGTLYDPDVAKVERYSVEEARKALGRLVAEGVEDKLDEHAIVSRHGRAGVAVVPLSWYRLAREALGDPTDA